MPKRTTEDFIKLVYELVGNEYEVTGVYTKSSNLIEMKHNICGFVFNIRVSNFLYLGQRCRNPECNPNINRNKKRTTEEFKKEVYDLVGDEYIVIGEYHNSQTKVEFLHSNCGHRFYMIPSKFKFGQRCPTKFCNKYIGHKITKADVSNKLGKCYILLDNFNSSKDRVNIKHILCGRIYDSTVTKIIHKGFNCPYCTKSTRKFTLDDIKSKVYDLVGDEYTILSDKYERMSGLLRFRHNACNREFMTQSNSFLYRNSRYTLCRETRGERRVYEHLIKFSDLDIIREFKFDDCKHINPLPFDFKIKYNNRTILIEYDGEQHFEPIFGEKSFDSTIRNDKIKNDFCLENNIPLLRIPYDKFNEIETLIDNFLEKFNDQSKDVLPKWVGNGEHPIMDEDMV